ncbi:hypothetical protein DDB_G0278333 [Dictyostelium discoideum AX4]|uniref:Peptidase S49 domain-containing protein n=1 Tax=Dictyostelium discoideum TaxID=44689 RepID=Q54YA6_DICDI|nr:hypothetical protein DDB_G0278333 [Dictyostelium discoideum AX4]EAL68339.1 hypothetical protein DDB_G0278333 [Dictyostelium discoideum AX4]|eukprot:XP_642296.1 hypothetical protein DDB_G0278333 [Dictyostelium discoideum AX4]
MSKIIHNLQNIELDSLKKLGEVTKYLNEHPMLRSFLISTGLIVTSKLIKLIKNRIRNNTILEIDFTNTIDTSDVDISPIEKLLDPNIISFRSLLDAIEKAANDKRVIGLIVRLSGENQFSLANIQEFRNAISFFKSKGKRTVAFTDSFCEAGSGIGRYYMASIFHDVYMAPSGTLNLINTQYDFAFIKKTLEKLNIVPDTITRKEYKNALSGLVNEHLTEPEKESMNAIFKSLYEQIIEDIAKDRSLTKERVNELFESGPFSSDKALVNKLVDSTLYGDEVYTTTYEKLETTKKNSNLLYAHKYNAKTKPLYGKKFGRSQQGVIALINAEGTIHQGTSANKYNGGPSIGSDSLVLAIRSATLDKDVKAIVIRVNSGGGSYIASDMVHHEIEASKKAGKKIVISMGTYCASGGYFFACNADKIVALGATLTGSIGVLTAKFNLKGMWEEKVHVKFDALHLNPDGATDNSTYFSSLHNYTEKQLAEVNSYMDFIYEDFTSKVSKGRRLTRDQVEEIARGRVWTGAQALKLSLVDKLGGLKEAIEVAKELVGIASNVQPHVVTYPKETVLSQLVASSANNSQDLERRGTPAQASITHSVGVSTSIFTKFSTLTKLILLPNNSISSIANTLINNQKNSNILSMNQSSLISSSF